MKKLRARLRSVAGGDSGWWLTTGFNIGMIGVSAYRAATTVDQWLYLPLIAWFAVILGRRLERRWMQPQIADLERMVQAARESSHRAYQIADQRISEIRAEVERRT